MHLHRVPLQSRYPIFGFEINNLLCVPIVTFSDQTIFSSFGVSFPFWSNTENQIAKHQKIISFFIWAYDTLLRNVLGFEICQQQAAVVH